MGLSLSSYYYLAGLDLHTFHHSSSTNSGYGLQESSSATSKYTQGHRMLQQ